MLNNSVKHIDDEVIKMSVKRCSDEVERPYEAARLDSLLQSRLWEATKLPWSGCDQWPQAFNLIDVDTVVCDKRFRVWNDLLVFVKVLSSPRTCKWRRL